MKKEHTLKTNKEKARHGDIFLPVNSYHCLIPFTYRELALHWHEPGKDDDIRQYGVPP